MFGVRRCLFKECLSRPASGSDIPANVLMIAPSLFNVHLSSVANRERQPFTENKEIEGGALEGSILYKLR